MSKTVRAFIAVPVECSPSLRRMLQRLAAIQGTSRAVNPDQLHVTLKFLGDVPWTEIPDISNATEKCVRRAKFFQAEIGSLGAFPNILRPRVVWSSISPAEPLSSLAQDLNDALGALGYPREERAFVPHVTLARVKGKPPAELVTLLRESRQTDFGSCAVESIVLYQSEPSQSGPCYIPLSEHALPE